MPVIRQCSILEGIVDSSDAIGTGRREAPARGRSNDRTAKQPLSDPALRETGIRVIDPIPWGAHICMFYETRVDLLDAAVAFFTAGFDSNEFCLWAVSPPITEAAAKAALRRNIPDFDRHLSDGRIELINAAEWYLKGDQFDLQRITDGWGEKLSGALAKGYDGVRLSGNAFWIGTKYWTEFCEYEGALDRFFAGKKMVVLCTYSLRASRAVDMLDVARAHQISIARRHGDWELLETPEFKQAKQEIKRLNQALGILPRLFPGDELLTPRERATLAQIVRGASSKEAARALDISPRTVEFHRTNLLKKTGAKNTVDLVRMVLGE
jgi:DNA-binding CsgD family transcriptional regulator